MKYLQKLQHVEAEPVQLGGERLMVVAAGAGGRAHAVPADVFELFFAPETPETPKAAADRALVEEIKAAGFRPAPKPVGKPAAKKTAAPRQASAPSTAPATETDGSDLTTGEAIMRAVAEGPRTQHETIDRVCDLLGWDRTNKDLRNRVYGNIWNRVDRGALIKRDCPETHLSKLYLPGGAK